MERLMRSEGLWHLVEQIFGYLDYKTVVECRKVSKLWHESLEWISLVKILLQIGDKLAEYHRSVIKDPEEKVLAIISGWKNGVQKYERTASIENLRELKDSLQPSLVLDGKFCKHPIRNAVNNVELLKFLFGTSYRVEAFHLACEFGNVEAAKWILGCLKENCAGFDLNATYNLGKNRGKKRGQTAFHLACENSNSEIAELILDFMKENGGIDLNARERREMTPFHFACQSGNTKTVKLILDFAKENGGFDLNARDNTGMTPFRVGCYACKKTKTEITKLFLDFAKENGGIDLNARDNFRGWTPFHRSCSFDEKIAQLILDFSVENGGIDLNARDNRGETGFHLACQWIKHVKILLDFIKEKDVVIDLNIKDNEGTTAFNLACQYGNPKVVKFLLDFSKENGRIDLNTSDNLGRTAFHKACEYNAKHETVKLILDFAKENENDLIVLDSRDNEGRTPFLYACDNGCTDIATLILENWKEAGINIKAQDNEGNTALDILSSKDKTRWSKIISILEEEYSKMDSCEPAVKRHKKE